MDKNFSRTRSTRDIMVSAGLVIAGIAIVAVPSAVSVNILGAFLCFVGLVTFFMLKSARVDKETGIKYKRIVKYFPSEKKDDIINALSSDPQKFNWSEKDDSEGIMVDIYYNLKVNKVYAHCFKYIPYEYCSCSDWYELDADKCGNMLLD